MSLSAVYFLAPHRFSSRQYSPESPAVPIGWSIDDRACAQVPCKLGVPMQPETACQVVAGCSDGWSLHVTPNSHRNGQARLLQCTFV